MRRDAFGVTRAIKLVGVTLAALTLLIGCGSQHFENYDAAQ